MLVNNYVKDGGSQILYTWSIMGFRDTILTVLSENYVIANLNIDINKWSW